MDGTPQDDKEHEQTSSTISPDCAEAKADDTKETNAELAIRTETRCTANRPSAEADGVKAHGRSVRPAQALGQMALEIVLFETSSRR